MDNIALLNLFLSSEDIRITQDGQQTRLTRDIEESLLELTEEAQDQIGEVEELEVVNKLAIKHIKKLESMLDKRNATYKNWDDTLNS